MAEHVESRSTAATTACRNRGRAIPGDSRARPRLLDQPLASRRSLRDVELQLDVVRIAEGDQCGPGGGGDLHARVLDPRSVEPAGPRVELLLGLHAERQMVEAGAPLAELVVGHAR